jgi:hypothetical protein
VPSNPPQSVVVVDPDRAVTCLVTRPQPETVREPLRSLLLTLLIDQEAVIDVVQWDVVLRVVGHLPAVLRRRRIEDLVVV